MRRVGRADENVGRERERERENGFYPLLFFFLILTSVCFLNVKNKNELTRRTN